jgi:protease-4
MSINNLHSLLNGRYFIHEAYGTALLPSLFAMLDGKTATISASDKKHPEPVAMGRGGMPLAAGPKSGGGSTEYVLVLDIKDPIYKYSQDCGPQGTKTKMRILDMYKNDAACAGVVLDIDSGGGQVSGTPEFYDYLLNYGKPVVAYTDGYMCSAAYYIGSASQYIVANKRADHIGSIGAMVHFVDVTGMYEAQGAKVITEYATKSTAKNRDFENLIKGDAKGYIKNQLDPIVEDFHADMKSARTSLSEETLTGGTYNATDSLKLGLIDAIGTLQTAVDKVFELSASQKSNQNSNNMSTPRANLQAVLGLTQPLAETDGGSYLNATQLEAIETDLTTKDGTIATLTADAATAVAAKATAETNLAEANAAHTTAITAHEGAVDAILTAAGLTPTGTLTDKIAALGTHQAELNAKDGARTTNVQTDGKPAADAIPDYLDAGAAHNQIAKNIFN